MQYSLLEKLAASALICAWVIYGSHFMGEALVKVREHEPAMAALALPTAEEREQPEVAAAEPLDLAALLAAADPASGEKAYSKCRSCHTIDEGGPNRVGPNLYNVVGAAKAHLSGFNYSSALAGLGGTWTYENLDAFLADPRGYAPGTKMSFAGIRSAEERAALILYLRQNTASPPPLP